MDKLKTIGLYIAAGLLIVLAAFGLINKQKVDKALKRAKNAEDELATQKMQNSLDQAASDIEEGILMEQVKRKKEESKQIYEIQNLPEEELSEASKKTAASILSDFS